MHSCIDEQFVSIRKVHARATQSIIIRATLHNISRERLNTAYTKLKIKSYALL